MDHNFYQFSVLYFHKSFVLSFCNASPNSHQSVNPDLVEQILGPIPMTLWEQEETRKSSAAAINAMLIE